MIGRSPSEGRCRWTSTLWMLSSLLAGTAAAQSHDFRIEKLGNPIIASDLANAAFRSFARQMGAAMTSVDLAPPQTLGQSGFSVNVELAVVSFRGGRALPVADGDGFRGPLLMPSIHVRKGLPWSFEVGARAAWIEKSQMGVASAELKWALNEGYTFLPDIGVRAHLSKLLNARSLELLAGGLDVSLGKRFSFFGMMSVTPYLGWDLVFVGASTSNVDFDPSASLADAETGAGAAQFRNLYVFRPLSVRGLSSASDYPGQSLKDNAHNRFYGGFRLGADAFQLGAEVSYSVIGRTSELEPEIDVIAVNLTLGMQF